MEQQEKQQYQAIVHKMLGAMVQLKGSDLFLTAGFPPAIKLNGKLTKLNENAVSAEQTSKMARAIASEKQWQSYIDTKGQNFA
ncbi:MAG: type IV pili twitching motility protein PilT, partial [Ramlibacter sp.]